MKRTETITVELSIYELEELIKKHFHLNQSARVSFNLGTTDYDGPGCPQYKVNGATLSYEISREDKNFVAKLHDSPFWRPTGRSSE